MELDLNLPVSQPTTQDILDFGKHYGLVGEEDTFLLLTFATTNKISCGVESLSGSGKTVLADTITRLFPPDRVYKMGLGSKTAETYNAAAINSCDLIYVEELQKVIGSNNPIVIEMLKNLTEGKDLNRTVTTRTETGKFKTERQRVKGDIGVLYSLAFENKMQKDAELNRRVLTFMTDITEGQNKRVVKALAKRRFMKEEENILSNTKLKEIRDHIAILLTMKKVDVRNPFWEYIADSIPTSFTISRSYVSHYLNLIDSCTKFHFKKRVMKGKQLFVNLQDIYTIHKLYGATFNQRIHNLPPLGMQIMYVISNAAKFYKKDKDKLQQSLYYYTEDESEERYFTIDLIHKALKDRHMLISHGVIRDQCELLVEAGFLSKEIYGKSARYKKANEVKEFEDEFNFSACFKSGLNYMTDKYPEYVNEWLKSQYDENNCISLENPINGEKITLVDLSKEFENKKKEKEKEIKEIEEFKNQIKERAGSTQDEVIEEEVKDEQ